MEKVSTLPKGTGLVSSGKKKKERKLLSGVQLFATPRTVALPGPLSMGFSRPEYWSG